MQIQYEYHDENRHIIKQFKYNNNLMMRKKHINKQI